MSHVTIVGGQVTHSFFRFLSANTKFLLVSSLLCWAGLHFIILHPCWRVLLHELGITLRMREGSRKQKQVKVLELKERKPEFRKATILSPGNRRTLQSRPRLSSAWPQKQNWHYNPLLSLVSYTPEFPSTARTYARILPVDQWERSKLLGALVSKNSPPPHSTLNHWVINLLTKLVNFVNSHDNFLL